MSYHVPREGRPTNDRSIHGGPLSQKEWTGGMNLDRPASELRANEVALAENVIMREWGPEARPGAVQNSQSGFGDWSNNGPISAYEYSPITMSGTYAGYRHCFIQSSTGSGAMLVAWHEASPSSDYFETTPADNAFITLSVGSENSDATLIPYRRGMVAFTIGPTYGGIYYCEPKLGWKLNSPNPVAGIKDQSPGSGHRYRVIATLSRITVFDQTGAPATASDRLTAGAIVDHESGSNGKAYANSAGAAVTTRTVDFGTITRATVISVSDPLVIPQADLRAFFSSAADSDDNTASGHWTHVSFYVTADLDAAGPDGAKGNEALFVWAGDHSRATIFAGSATYSIALEESTIRQRILDGSLLLKSRFYEPLPNGDCGEITPGFLFVADRSNTSPETKLCYCPLSAPEHIGYYLPKVYEHSFKDGIRALRHSGDILSIFCNNSSHTCTLTAIEERSIGAAFLQVLTHWREVDPTLGVRDWGTLANVDKSTFIACCSDGSVRLWDTEKWGDDLSDDKVSSEIKAIVPATPATFARGSYGRFYAGAYYLWYSKNSADTSLGNTLRLALRKRAGYGWTFYKDWIKLPFKCGATLMVDAFGVQRFMGFAKAATSGSFVAEQLYWLESFNLYTGASEQSTQPARKDTDAFVYGGSAGAEIATKIRFRELKAVTEKDDIIHAESNAYWRPLVEADGFRSGFAMTVKAYINGSTTAAETLLSQAKTGDIHFTKEISGHRIQLEVSTNRGACRMVGFDSLCRSLERPNYKTAGSNVTDESSTSYPHWQKELANNLLHWITRRDYLWDRAKGVKWTGSGTTLLQVDGPDGKTGSALFFGGYSLTVPNATALSGDFTVVFSVKTPGDSYFISAAAGAGASALSIRITGGNLEILYMGAAAATLQVPVTLTNNGWDTFVIVRSGSAIIIYQNGTQVGTATSALSFGGGTQTIGFPASSGSLFDIRIYTDNLSTEAIAYYWAELNDNDGAAILPLM